MTYACHNAPRPTPGETYPVQDGYEIELLGGQRRMTTARVLRSVAECRYDRSGEDVRCKGCRWGKE